MRRRFNMKFLRKMGGLFAQHVSKYTPKTLKAGYTNVHTHLYEVWLHTEIPKYAWMNTFEGEVPYALLKHFDHGIMNPTRWRELQNYRTRRAEWIHTKKSTPLRQLPIPYNLNQLDTAYYLYMEMKRREINHMKERLHDQTKEIGTLAFEKLDIYGQEERMLFNYGQYMIALSRTYLSNDDDVNTYWTVCKMDDNRGIFWTKLYRHNRGWPSTPITDINIKRLIIAQWAYNTTVEAKLKAIEGYLCQHTLKITHLPPTTKKEGVHDTLSVFWDTQDKPKLEAYLREHTNMFWANEPFEHINNIDTRRTIMIKYYECKAVDEQIEAEWDSYPRQPGGLAKIEQTVCEIAPQFNVLSKNIRNEWQVSRTTSMKTIQTKIADKKDEDVRKYRPFSKIQQLKYKRKIVFKYNQIKSVNAHLNDIIRALTQKNIPDASVPEKWTWDPQHAAEALESKNNDKQAAFKSTYA
jgi:hypothetical protein